MIYEETDVVLYLFGILWEIDRVDPRMIAGIHRVIGGEDMYFKRTHTTDTKGRVIYQEMVHHPFFTEETP